LFFICQPDIHYISSSLPPPLPPSLPPSLQAFLSISLETIQRVCAVSEALALPPSLLLSPTGVQAVLAALLNEDEDGREEGEDGRMES
jgi:hypothetical protein